MVQLLVKSNNSQYDVIVLGAGASGLMCAFIAAQRGLRVLVLEKANKVGKKILMSGGGRCNFTNYSVEAENFISGNPHFCKAALKRYTQWDFIAMVERHGIDYEERKHGQLFCKDSAKDILNMLLNECEQAGVEIRTRCDIQKVTRIESSEEENSSGSDELPRYRIISMENENKNENPKRVTMLTRALVVATGALSIPTLGGSGLGYELAQRFDLPLVERRAGLVPFTFSDHLKPICERLSGIALEVEVSCNQQSFTENMLFTHRGLSGPAMLQISNYWAPGDALQINLLPAIDLTQHLLQAKRDSGKSLLKTILGGLLAKSLVAELQMLLWPDSAEWPLAQFSDKQLTAIASELQNWRVKPSGTEGYRTAEVTLGGVDTSSISSKTMEVKHMPGLYFIGEVLDVTGHLGGFNFQWAWSSGYSAGMAV